MSATTESDTEVDLSTTDRLQELVSRAQAGDPTSLLEIREYLDANPTLWQRSGDLAQQAQAAWLKLLCGTDLLLRETIERKLAALRTELEGPNSTPLANLIIEEVLACWLQTHAASCQFAQAAGGQTSPAILRNLQRREESSQRRYLAAIKMLATIRKLRPEQATVDQPKRPASQTKSQHEGRNDMAGEILPLRASG